MWCCFLLFFLLPSTCLSWVWLSAHSSSPTSCRAHTHSHTWFHIRDEGFERVKDHEELVLKVIFFEDICNLLPRSSFMQCVNIYIIISNPTWRNVCLSNYFFNKVYHSTKFHCHLSVVSDSWLLEQPTHCHQPQPCA